MLIWGRPGYQTMMIGASDPVSFFVIFKTEPYGTAKLVKTSEDGIVSGITFHISGTDSWEMKSMRKSRPEKTARLKRSSCPGTYLIKGSCR